MISRGGDVFPAIGLAAVPAVVAQGRRVQKKMVKQRDVRKPLLSRRSASR
ncbi:hypothetical protein [Janibacter sp. G368]